MGKVKVKKADLWRAIRDHCTNCSGDSIKERTLCPCDNCNLYPYRNGFLDETDPIQEGVNEDC